MMSKVFCELLEALRFKIDNLFCSLRVDFLHHSAVQYAQIFAGKGSPLLNCVGFLYCPKTVVWRPGMPTSNQNSCYSKNKRSHCLVCQTITIRHNLLQYRYVLEKDRRYDMTPYSKSNRKEFVQDDLVIKWPQFYDFGDILFVMRPWCRVVYGQSLAGPYKIICNTAVSST